MRKDVLQPVRGALVVLSALLLTAHGAEPPAPMISGVRATNGTVSLRFQPYPAAEAYSILSATSPAAAFVPDPAFRLSPYTNAGSTNPSGYEWRRTNTTAPSSFYKVQATPMGSNALLAAIVLNRLTYGPTPDELERIASIGADAYISEQRAPWSITESAELASTSIGSLGTNLVPAGQYVDYTKHANLVEFRAWHVLRAVNANRQLLEILLQFLENHFVTEYGKSFIRLQTFYTASSANRNAFRERVAAQFEYRENAAWRAALLNPSCTFYDLLRISAESPAMIIYLDTIDSRGDNGRIANENYSRELCELFCFGVDNGYDQTDIEQMSRGWTGWRVDLVDLTNVFNPFATRTTTIVPGSSDTNTADYANLYGAWAFNYRGTTGPDNRHDNGVKTIFGGKTVPARFGPPWAGQNYQLVLNNGAGTNGIQDGYQIIAHMANQPFTAEYLSIKLCRLLVHDGFPNPTTNTNLPEYAYYDYTSGTLTPEASLVRACMMAWETNSPRGQIWKVIQTITDSDLFRTHSASMHKVKDPLEFCVSAIRALRSSTNGSHLDGTFTASTDGYSISGSSGGVDNATTSPLNRMGRMLLFDREAPDGYPQEGAAWISAGTLAERTRFIQSYCIAQGQSGHSGTGSNNDAVNCISNPVLLIRTKLPAAAWTNAPAIAEWFLDTLYPAVGAGNLQLYQKAAESFLNTDVNGNNSPFGNLSPNSTPGTEYDTRVRGMVALLMASPRFHEQ